MRTGGKRTYTTGSIGSVSILELPAGSYKLVAIAADFNEYQARLALSIGQTAS